MTQRNRYGEARLIAVPLIIVILTLIFFSRCNTQRKTQGQKDYESRIERQQTLEAVRKQFPCDTGKLIQGQVITTPQYIYIDNPLTGYHKRVECPPSLVRVDTLPVYDMALLQIVRDSVDNLKFLLDGAIQANKDLNKEKDALQDKISGLKPFKTKYIAAIIIWSIIGLFFIARRFKLI